MILKKVILKHKLNIKEKIKKANEYGCEKCGLFKNAKRPIIGWEGDPNYKLLFIDECPNSLVDSNDKERFFKGGIGDGLRIIEMGFKMKQTLRGYAYQCRNSNPSSDIYAKCCRDKMIKMIKELKPTTIISFGEIATNSLMNTVNKISIQSLRGRIIPSHEFNCVIMPTFNYREFRHKDQITGQWVNNYARKTAFELDLKMFIGEYESTFHNRKYVNDLLNRRNILKEKKIHQITNLKQLAQLQTLLEEKGVFSFDYETTNNKPYDSHFEIISLCFAHESEAWVLYLADYLPENLIFTKHIVLQMLNNPKLLKLIQNKQFEELCTRWWCQDELNSYQRDELGQVIINYFDTMLASHVIDEREGGTALDFQTQVRFGIRSFYDENKMSKWIKVFKPDKVNKIKECPKELLIEYTGHDGIETFHNWKACKHYLTKSSDKYPWCLKFISEGSDVFANMSERGIPINKKRLNQLNAKFENIDEIIQNKIKNDKDIIGFEKKRGKILNVQSPQQMRDFLYNYLKLTPIKKTKGGKKGIKENATDESVILHHAEKDNVPFCGMAIKKRKLKKGMDVLRGIDRFTTLDSKMHPSFWMNTTATVRSSSSDINFQNVPIHGMIIEDEDFKIPWEIVREVFEREGKEWIIAEVDFERNEVVGAANLSGDEQLIKDINTDFDMHSHWTNVIFGWNYPFEDYKTNKKLQDYRYLTKNNWTFANFYKAGNKSIAESFRKFDVYLKFLQEEYNKKEIKQPFEKWVIPRSEEHILECQNYFYDRYSTFKTTQDDWMKFYYDNGFIETPLGFRRHYPMQSTEIVNFPIQATSYHILLDACIRIEKRIIKEKRKSTLRAQIHDSLWIMIYLDEVLDIIDLVNYEMINHNLSDVPKLAKLGTEWSVGVSWGNMHKISSLL